MKFKEGDVVILRKGLQCNKKYGGLTFIHSIEFTGYLIVNQVDTSDNSYKLSNDFWYTDDMLLPAGNVVRRKRHAKINTRV